MDSANLKINRAKKHIVELNELFSKNRPFAYIFEKNIQTGECATFAERNETIACNAAIICGDIIHNLRSALDHAYWDITNVFAKSEGERRSIQFPISKSKKALQESVIPGLPSRVSKSFAQAITDLKPYREHGGNQALCNIHDLDIIDKHKLLIPTGNYTRISSDIIRRQVPEFPRGFTDCGFGQSKRDIVWSVPRMNRATRRSKKFRRTTILKQKLNVPIDIVFSVGSFVSSQPVIATLNELIDITKCTVNIIRNT